MPAAVALILAGFTLAYSALTGKSLVEVLSGAGLPHLNPAGGRADSGGPAAGAGSHGPSGETGADPQHQFKGPHAAQLRELAQTAETHYHLRITEICRPPDATYGAPDSLHKSCRAFDSVGTVADRVAFARYAKSLSWVAEVFCDQAGYVAPGYNHSDHVHVGA